MFAFEEEMLFSSGSDLEFLSFFGPVLFYYVFFSFKIRFLETNLPNKTHLTKEPVPDSYKIQAPKLKVKGNALDTLFYESLKSLII